MRILYFGDAVQFHLRRWVHFFVSRGHDCHVLTFNSDILPNYDPAQVHLIRKQFHGNSLLLRGMNVPALVAEMRSTVARINPDLIHAFSSTAYAWCAAVSGIHPLVVSPTGSDLLIQARDSFFVRVMTRFALSRADVVHTDSDNVTEALGDLGVPAFRIAKIRYGTDMDKFRPGPADEAFNMKHEFSKSHIVISTRRLDPVHDVTTFIQAIPLVLERFNDVEFVIIGWGDQYDALVEQACSLGISQAVRFLGRVEEHEMIEALHAAEVYVSCSISESGIAASTAEAMACGLPVVTTEVGDMRQWIREGENGFFFPQNDYRTLADRIVQLLRNPDLREDFGKKNRALVTKDCNYETEMNKFDQLYHRLVEKV